MQHSKHKVVSPPLSLVVSNHNKHVRSKIGSAVTSTKQTNRELMGHNLDPSEPVVFSFVSKDGLSQSFTIDNSAQFGKPKAKRDR